MENNLIVNRWKRYGHDRLYVETAEGQKLGYWNLIDNTIHVEKPEYEPIINQEYQQWLQNQKNQPKEKIDHKRQPVETSPETETVGKTLIPEQDTNHSQTILPQNVDEPKVWIDLSNNKAGEAAGKQAEIMRSAAPVKTFVARIFDIKTEERAWRIGADGEKKVAAELSKLVQKDNRWRYIHAVPVGNKGSDIDHVLIGPSGIFTINTKHHPKANIWVAGNTFIINGTKVPYIRNSKFEASRASKLLTTATGLPVNVEGLIVTVNTANVTIKNQPENVHIIYQTNLLRWLLSLGEIYDQTFLDTVYDHARRSTTWKT